MELLKLLSANELVAQTINFLLLLALLRVFMWKRVLKLLDDRREKISSELKNIDDVKSEVERLRLEYEAKISSTEEFSRSKIEAAIEEGRRVAQKIKDEAEQDSERIAVESRETIKRELSKAKEELQTEIVDITIKIAEKVIEERLSEGTDKKIVEDFLNRIDKT